MESKWSKHKAEAILLRKQGKSLPYVHTTLGIPKSTLSYWFKDVTLTDKQKLRLHTNWKNGLVKARSAAVVWHNNGKRERLQMAERQAIDLLEKIDVRNLHITELALALLYLGEGTKAKEETGMGSSDPVILKFFIYCLRNIYDVPEDKIKYELHLRADQNPEKMMLFWAKELGVKKANFSKPYLDQRTVGTTTYDTYNGVCLVRCGQVAIQRKLVYIAKHFCRENSTSAK